MTVKESEATADSIDPDHGTHTAVLDAKGKSKSLQFWDLKVWRSDAGQEYCDDYKLVTAKGVIDHLQVETTRTAVSVDATPASPGPGTVISPGSGVDVTAGDSGLGETHAGPRDPAAASTPTPAASSSSDTLIGPRGGQYHYSANGNKVYGHRK